ncbi:MAG: hypothetical protein M0R33_06790 [Methylomonas sp.]|uniref:hypothetical protein n=1 Tax=Methylomonas sp. TaxID=418 RepID=UPI0025D57228|nr:hypothetical protein [Methylomonas sp.]MCK9606145.1 hypothetical protein [Methylomonas sp.]
MKKILLTLLAIILIIEEWLWDALSAFGHALVRWLNLQRVELWLSQTPPNTALIAFLIPMLLIIPINAAVLNLLVLGLILKALMLEILAKLLATVIVARVFALTKPQLLTFRYISLMYITITAWLNWAHQKLVETAIYQSAKRWKAEVKLKFAAWLQ